MSLDIDKIPPEVSDLKGEGIIYNLPFIGFMSHGYFDYKAEASYFTRFEKQILQVPCQTLSTDFSYWEKDGFKGEFIKSDQCFSGTIGPYLHYIFYDSSSRRVQHFVTGIRD